MKTSFKTLFATKLSGIKNRAMALFTAVCVCFTVCFSVLPKIFPKAEAAVFPSPSAEVTDVKSDKNDDVFTISFSGTAEAVSYEKERQAALSEFRKTWSDKQIAASEYAPLLYPTELTVSVYADFAGTAFAASFPIDTIETEISLLECFMPALAEEFGVSDKLISGFKLTVSVGITYSDGEKRVDLSDFASFYEMDVPETAAVSYELPPDAVNSPENRSFFFAPLLTDVKLASPERNGYTFTGWTDESGVYTGVIPAGSKIVKLQSHWDNRVYAVKYVLTTSSGANFMSVDNSDNPSSYIPSQGAKLYSPLPPKGWNFLGWSFENGETVTEIPPGTTGDVILYANWISDDDLIEKKIQEAHWGDLDGDGEVTVSDARLALRAAVKLDNLSDSLLERIDFAQQGKADITQARLLLRVAVQLDTLRNVLESYGRI